MELQNNKTQVNPSFPSLKQSQSQSLYIEVCQNCHEHSQIKHDQNIFYQLLQRTINQVRSQDSKKLGCGKNKVMVNTPFKYLSKVQPKNGSYSKAIKQAHHDRHLYLNEITKRIVRFPRLGAFEVYFNGFIVFSKLQSTFDLVLDDFNSTQDLNHHFLISDPFLHEKNPVDPNHHTNHRKKYIKISSLAELIVSVVNLIQTQFSNLTFLSKLQGTFRYLEIKWKPVNYKISLVQYMLRNTPLKHINQVGEMMKPLKQLVQGKTLKRNYELNHKAVLNPIFPYTYYKNNEKSSRIMKIYQQKKTKRQKSQNQRLFSTKKYLKLPVQSIFKCLNQPKNMNPINLASETEQRIDTSNQKANQPKTEKNNSDQTKISESVVPKPEQKIFFSIKKVNQQANKSGFRCQQYNQKKNSKNFTFNKKNIKNQNIRQTPFKENCKRFNLSQLQQFENTAKKISGFVNCDFIDCKGKQKRKRVQNAKQADLVQEDDTNSLNQNQNAGKIVTMRSLSKTQSVQSQDLEHEQPFSHQKQKKKDFSHLKFGKSKILLQHKIRSLLISTSQKFRLSRFSQRKDCPVQSIFYSMDEKSKNSLNGKSILLAAEHKKFIQPENFNQKNEIKNGSQNVHQSQISDRGIKTASQQKKIEVEKLEHSITRNTRKILSNKTFAGFPSRTKKRTLILQLRFGKTWQSKPKKNSIFLQK